jgi:hypothetical protein
MMPAEQLQREAAAVLGDVLETASHGVETDLPALAELVVAKILAAAHLGSCGSCAGGLACTLGERLFEEANR